jgi:hypothetical protein
MCLISWLFATFTAIAAASGPVLGAAPEPPAAADPLLPYLQDDDSQARAQVLKVLREQGRPPCPALGAYAGNGNSRVRGNAVQAMDDAGCSDFDAYGAYLLDGSASVLSALVEAAERHLMKDAVPFLLGSLFDRRRIVTERGTWSIGERAQHALMVITCQSFHFDPATSRDDQRNAVTRWRQWYLAKRDLPRDEWVQEGIGRARDYAQRDYGPYRVEGLRLLALIGPQALPALRELLARKPDDLKAEVVCQPDEPPRVTDAVPCALLVRNSAGRRVAIAPPPDGPEVRLVPSDAPPDERPPARGGAAAPASPRSPGPPDRPPGTEGPAAALGAFADRLVDLAPGEVLRFEFKAGPVLFAGRYRVRAALPDLAAGLAASAMARDGGAAKRVGETGPRASVPPSTIEAETIVRFEQ